MSSMFHDCRSLESLDVSRWDTSNVENMNMVFYKCSKMKSLDVSKWATSKVSIMTHTFDDCEALESIDVSRWDTTSATQMFHMFDGCKSLKAIDVSGWDTSKVTYMNDMFKGCHSLKAIDVSGWDTSKVTHMNSMFNGCASLESLDMSGWDTSSVTDDREMFLNCPSLSSYSVGSGFTIAEALPDSTVENNSWWSVRERRWIPSAEIRQLRACIADTYRTYKSIAISGAAISGVSPQPYTGRAITPVPTIRVGQSTLENDVDFKLTYANNVNAGTATIAVTGMGEYDGGLEVTFTIAKATQVVSASDRRVDVGVSANLGAKTSGDGKLTYRSSNSAIATVDASGKVTGVGPGTAKVTVRAAETRNWKAASKTVTITVSAIDISRATVAKVGKKVETGKKIKPSPKVSLGGTTLRKGTDYTLSYRNNKRMGTATIVVTGRGRYAGTRKVTFRILGDVSLSRVYYQSRGKPGKYAKITKVVYRDGRKGKKKLKKGRDYTLKWTRRAGGGATLRLRGKGKYGGTAYYDFEASEL